MSGLTNDDLLEIVRLSLDEGMSHREIANHIGSSKTAVGRFLRRESFSDFWEANDKKPVASGTKVAMHEKRKRLDGRRFVLFSAQNNTFVHNEFLESLKVFAKENDARLIAGRFHYNKNGFQNTTEDDNNWFDPKIQEYVLDEDCFLANDLIWCGSLDILPTAANPLSGFHSYTGTNSGIIPHAKVQLQSLPTSKHTPAKMLYTTGSVTQMNYIQRKAGQKAEFHHVFGALYVTVDDDGDWFVRQLNADSKTGCFYDLDKYYTPEGVSSGNAIEAVNWGDIHAAQLDDDVADISWNNESSILDTLKPKYQFIHDVFDMKYRNHHNIGNQYFRFEMHCNNTDSVSDEVAITLDVMQSMKREWSKVIVVESNHDLALKRWLTSSDYRLDPANALFFLELQLESYKAIASGDKAFNVFKKACEMAGDISGIEFLKTDEQFVICGGIECGQHGHNGNNGGRGSIRAFQVQGSKSNIGHGHSATILDGVYMAGVSGNLDMGYNVGGSSWSNSHILTYKNGKRAIVTIKNGKWR